VLRTTRTANPLLALVGNPPKDPRAMTPAQINRELDTLSRQSSSLNDALLAAGRGNERTFDLIARGRLPGAEPLAAGIAAVAARSRALHDEIVGRYGPGAPSRLPHGFKRRANPPRPNPGRDPKDRGYQGTATIAEATRVRPEGHERALSVTRAWNGGAAQEVDVYRYDDGKPGLTRVAVVALGRVPTSAYKGLPDSPLKGPRAAPHGWEHPHPKRSMPLEVYNPLTGVTSKIGGTYWIGGASTAQGAWYRDPGDGGGPPRGRR
jgi:hypothetical protein